MKSAIAFVGVCALVCQIAAFTEEGKARYKEIREMCLQEVPLGEDVLAKLRNHEFTEGDDANKFLFCVNKKFGTQNEDGSFNPSALKEVFTRVADMEGCESCVDECIAVDLKDGPANAGAFIKCIMTKLPNGKWKME